jgi:hypothetical protein
VCTGRQAQLRQALSSLEGDPSSLATLIAAVQKVVFAPDVSTTAPNKSIPTGGGRTASPEVTITTLEGEEKGGIEKRSRP